jgi:hypothetical protein
VRERKERKREKKKRERERERERERRKGTTASKQETKKDSEVAKPGKERSCSMFRSPI